jgi:alkylhydroperoxidase family enzyme
MSAIPFVSADLSEPAAIVGAIRARRGGRLLNLDRMLLHSPSFARGWNSLLGATRSELALPARLRELCICAVGILNGAEYEVQQHSAPFLDAGGTARQLQALRAIEAAIGDGALFGAIERAALRLCLIMTRELRVPPALVAELRQGLGSDTQLVELVGVIATYNMVARFLIALDVDLE